MAPGRGSISAPGSAFERSAAPPLASSLHHDSRTTARRDIRMRRSLAILGLTALAAYVAMARLGAQAGTTTPPTAESLVARNIEARGGAEKMRSAKTARMTGTVTMPGLPSGVSILIYRKRPNLERQDVALPGGALIVGFSGTTAWKIDPTMGSTVAMQITGAQAAAIEEQSMFDSPLLDAKARGFTVAYVGSEMFQGKTVDHLSVTDPKGRVQQCYLDAATGLESRIITGTGADEIEQQLSDYRVAG